jgi:hypothetical protein
MIHDPILKLLGLCVPLDEYQPDEIRTFAGQITDWNHTIQFAEKSGFTPLLYSHLKRAEVDIPSDFARQCKALTIRHSLLNHARMNVLDDLTRIFYQNGIQSIALKGAALANILYPDLSLRPMGDIDILISGSDTEKVKKILQEMGFQPSQLTDSYENCAHLPPYMIKRDGFNVNVEIHTFLCQDKVSKPWFSMEEMTHPPQKFILHDRCSVHALCHEDMVFHLCWHAFYDHRSFTPLNYLWVSDIVNYAEKYVEQIDWNFVSNKYPLVVNSLSALNDFVPLSETLVSLSLIDTDHFFHSIGKDSDGWPMTPLIDFEQNGILKVLWATIFPPDWWLYLHHGQNKPEAISSYWLRHLGELAGEVKDRSGKRIRNRFQVKTKLY